MSYKIWPKDSHGEDVMVMLEPQLGISMCKLCWNGKHPKLGCKMPGCQCGCYLGRNPGLGKPHKPHKDCKENQSFPDVGAITV
jgi:hypothetical protein